MNPKSISRLLILSIITFSLSAGGSAVAAPVPPDLVVNHDTQECAELFAGDECMSCFPPDGWEVLGKSYEVECPAGYTFTDVEENCIHSKGEFCCSEGHSGASGNCEDLVINDKEDQCAFVDDINACNLPRGWKAKPEDVSMYKWTCPGKYDWMPDLECLPEGADEGDSGFLPLRCSGFALMGTLIPVALFTIAHQKRLWVRK
jgi:hypothetical protein